MVRANRTRAWRWLAADVGQTQDSSPAEAQTKHKQLLTLDAATNETEEIWH
jgi:hypothetical protein